MNSHEVAVAVMTHYSREYGNYATFSCDCGYDLNGAAWTFAGLEGNEYLTARIDALDLIIQHAEHEHTTPATVLVTPPAVAVNIVKFDRS